MKRTSILILTALLLFIFAIFIPSNVCAQSLDPAWALNFGENYSHNANSILQTEDGGYIIAGAGYLITKLNISGALEWQKKYLLDFNEEAHCIEETQDGGLIVAGTSSSNYFDKMWILKLDSTGNTEWQKLTTYAESSGFRSRAYSIKETLDQNGNPDGYVVVGSTIHLTGPSWRIWVLRIDLDGKPIWQKTYKLHTSGGYSIEQTFDSAGAPTGYIVAGSTGYYGNDAWLLKLNIDGGVDWQRIYGLSSQNANCIQQTVDGGFIVTGPGTADELAPGRHFWVAKLDSSGGFQDNGWQKVYGGQDGEDVPFSIQEVFDAFGNPNGYVVAGETSNFGEGQKDVWIIKIDNYGNIEWEKTYGGSNNESAQSIKQTFDQLGNPSGYAVAGYTWSYGTGTNRDAFVLKINVNGEIPDCNLMNDSVATLSEGDYWLHEIPSAFEVEESDAALMDTNADITEENFQPQVICYWEPTSIFVDIPSGYWAEEAIYKIYNAGITSGCSQTPLMYCPDSNVSRAQMAVFLGRGIHGSSFTPPAATGIFSDVPTNYWASKWIEQFYSDGITGGCGTSPLRYCPENPVTRAQMAVFLLRAKHGKNYTPPPATGEFSDVPVSHWAADWIEQLSEEGITSGCGTNPLRFCPSASVTRAQMAVFIVRAFGL